METKNKDNKVKDLEVYKLARKFSELAWKIYVDLDWRDKKTMGDQFIKATDSVGANIAEGYGRYHYRDKIKFFYNSRGSLYESCQHWLELLHERRRIDDAEYKKMKKISSELSPKLNSFIQSNYDKLSENKSTN